MVSYWSPFLYLFGGVIGGICLGRSLSTGDIGYFILGIVFISIYFISRYQNKKQHGRR